MELQSHKIKNIESGRSMVEILGVLSVMAMLSIASIYGYHQAMDSHHAAQTTDRIMKRAITVSTQKLLGQEADVSAFTETGAYTIELDATTKSPEVPYFIIKAQAIPDAVCKKIKAYEWKLPVIIPGECAETNNMTFKFTNDLKEQDSSASGGNEGGNGGNAGQTPVDCSNKPDDTDCADGGYCSNGECSCQNGGSLGTSRTLCCGQNGLAWDGQAYNTYNMAECGCPYDYNHNTSASREQTSDGYVCCSSGYQYDPEYGSYRLANPVCGCPNDGNNSVSPTYAEGLGTSICCSSGYEYDENSGSEYSKYTKYNPYCGCPFDWSSNPGTPTDYNGTKICCTTGYQWDPSQNYYSIYNPACGCPTSDEISQKTQQYSNISSPSVYTADPNNPVCCFNGYQFNSNDTAWNSGYNILNISACGCPADGGYTPYPNNGQCSSNGYGFNPNDTWTNNGYNLVDISAYGCPYDLYNGYYNTPPEQKEVNGQTICCSYNLQFDASNYTWTQDSYSNGWRNDGYKKYNIECGCPTDTYTTSTEKKENYSGQSPFICCGNGYQYDDSESYSSSRNNYSIYNPYCGCPQGTQSTLGSNGPICCRTDVSMRGLDYNGQVQSACFTAVGCPSGYTATPGSEGTICCDDNNNGYDYFSQYYEACRTGCPSGTFADYSGYCTSASVSSAVYLGSDWSAQGVDECYNAGNGKYPEYSCSYGYGCGYYCVNPCGSGYVRDASGSCEYCGNSGDIYMGSTYDSGQKCDYNCSGYGKSYQYKYGAYYCATDCSYGYILSSGSCTSCDAPYDIYMGAGYDSGQKCDYNCGSFGKSYQYKNGGYYCAATAS